MPNAVRWQDWMALFILWSKLDLADLLDCYGTAGRSFPLINSAAGTDLFRGIPIVVWDSTRPAPTSKLGLTSKIQGYSEITVLG